MEVTFQELKVYRVHVFAHTKAILWPTKATLVQYYSSPT